MGVEGQGLLTVVEVETRDGNGKNPMPVVMNPRKTAKRIASTDLISTTAMQKLPRRKREVVGTAIMMTNETTGAITTDTVTAILIVLTGIIDIDRARAHVHREENDVWTFGC